MPVVAVFNNCLVLLNLCSCRRTLSSSPGDICASCTPQPQVRPPNVSEWLSYCQPPESLLARCKSFVAGDWLLDCQQGLTYGKVHPFLLKNSICRISSAKIRSMLYTVLLQDYIAFTIKSSEFWKDKLLHVRRWASVANHHEMLWTCCFYRFTNLW